jgi:cell division protease FtsH
MAESPKPENKFPAWLPLTIVAAMVVFYLLFLPQHGAAPTDQIPYSQFKSLVRAERVDEITLQGYAIHGTLRSAESLVPNGQKVKHFSTTVPAFGDDGLLALLHANQVTVQVKPPASGGLWGGLLVAFLPWLVLLGIFLWIGNRAARRLGGGFGGAGDLNKFLEQPAKRAEVPQVTFADVAGQENAKREVSELVDFLKTPDRYLALGAEVPRGVLLMGPPGTGKTLLARALAGEAGVPFYAITGSEFIEVFVGVGASRVRKLFTAAKENAPSIIFIDELDSIGRTRGTGLGGGHDEREQTLNQILAEMDGFSGHEAVIVLAATNRPDVLDPALLRPGRFDRHVALDLPDSKDRDAILRVHLRKVRTDPDVDIPRLAAGTPGFSGADLKNLINEAAMAAARDQAGAVAMTHLDEARDRILLGSVRTLAIQPEERHRLAVHESGHTLVAYFLPHTDPLYKVTIIPRGRALGGTQQLPEAERHTLPEDYLKDRLAVMLAGRTAEQELLGTISSGADDDIRQATALARAMVGRWGMSREIGPVDLRESEEHPFLGREIAQPRHFSETSAQAVDSAVRQLLLEAEQRAGAVLRSHQQALARLIDELERHETLQREDIEACLGPQPAQAVASTSRTPPALTP